MINFLIGYFVGAGCLLLLARMLANTTIQTHELRPIAAKKIDPKINPIARLHQIAAQSLARKRHYEDQQAAAHQEACNCIAGPGELTEEEEEIVWSMILHNDYDEGIVRRVLEELL